MEQAGPRIDPEACVGCGACITACPSRMLALADGMAAVRGSGCIGCCHCEAVCPSGAVVVDVGDGWAEAFSTFAPTGEVSPPGRFPPAELVDLMRSRRSCRRYAARAVPGPVLEDLIRAAVTAPSGTNSQAWTFTVLASREAVMHLGEAVAGFFRRLNKLAANSIIRRALALVGRRELEAYYQEHCQSVTAALADWDRDRTDRLFHGATAVILIGSRPGASCPAEDALLAAGNLLLAAHAMGLGSCLIGYAVEAIRHDSRIGETVGIAPGEAVHAVVALGWPAVSYARPARRRRPLVRYKTA